MIMLLRLVIPLLCGLLILCFPAAVLIDICLPLGIVGGGVSIRHELLHLRG